MKQFEIKTSAPMVNSAPLFASVWLALYYEIRKSFTERRLATATNMESSPAVEKK